MKNFFKTILGSGALLAIVIFSFSVAAVMAAIDNVNDGWRSYGGTDKSIDVPTSTAGVTDCKTISNTSAVDYFIPTRTLTEWNSFLNSVPLSVSVNSCVFIAVTPTGLNFNMPGYDYTIPGSTLVKGFSIQNTGTSGNLIGTVTSSTPYFTCTSGCSFNIAPGLSSGAAITFSPDVAGSYSDNLLFSSNGGNINVSVYGYGIVTGGGNYGDSCLAWLTNSGQTGRVAPVDTNSVVRTVVGSNVNYQQHSSKCAYTDSSNNCYEQANTYSTGVLKPVGSCTSGSVPWSWGTAGILTVVY